MIHQGEFRDGTHISKSRKEGGELTASAVVSTEVLEQPGMFDASISQSVETMNGRPLYDSIRDRHSNFFLHHVSMSPVPSDIPETLKEEEDEDQADGEDEEKPTIEVVKPRARTATILQEVFDVKLLTEDNIVRVTCPKPAQLKVLLSELQVNTGLQEECCKVEYYNNDSGEIVQIQTQKQLEYYLQMGKKTQLCLSRPTVA